MKITLEAVRERIAALDSAGELSIKEQFYLDALRQLEAAMEAEPVGSFHIVDQQVDGTTDYIKDGEWPIDNGELVVYAVPPAPRVDASPVANGAWSGWCCQYPGKFPRLYGAKEIAEVNCDPANGDRLFKVVEVSPAQAAPRVDAEPVAWWTGPGTEIEAESFHDHETGSHQIPLYAAPPAPVAEHVDTVALHQRVDPDWCDAYMQGYHDSEARKTAPVAVPDAATAIRACLDEFPESVHDIVEECATIAENACGAAMQQPAPVATDDVMEEINRWAIDRCLVGRGHYTPQQNALIDAYIGLTEPPAPVVPDEAQITDRMFDALSADEAEQACYWINTWRAAMLKGEKS